MSFLQTEKWGEFQKALGADYFKIGGIFVFKYKLPFNKHYFYIPRADFTNENLKNIINEAQTMNPVFLRIEPGAKNQKDALTASLANIGFKKINQESQPSKTLILNLEKPEKEILSAMHHKTRYNIGIAEKNGVKIEIKKSLNKEEFEIFWKLINKTAKRDKFTIFSKKYYEKLLNIFSSSAPEFMPNDAPLIKIFLAKLQDEIIAAAIVMFYGDTAVYLHGASDYDFRKMMAPHLLQWNIISNAKKSGFLYYDFWGINENKWPGVTRFKKGFSGKEIDALCNFHR